MFASDHNKRDLYYSLGPNKQPTVKEPRPLHPTFLQSAGSTVNRSMIRSRYTASHQRARKVKRIIKRHAMRNMIMRTVIWAITRPTKKGVAV